jgi:hypothetical protein
MVNRKNAREMNILAESRPRRPANEITKGAVWLFLLSVVSACGQTTLGQREAGGASVSVETTLAVPSVRFFGGQNTFVPSQKVVGGSASVALVGYSDKPNEAYRPQAVFIGPPLIEPRGMVKGKGWLYISDSGHDENHSEPATIWRLDPKTKRLDVFYRGPLLINSKWLWFVEGAEGRPDELLVSDFGEEPAVHSEGTGVGAKVFAIEVRTDGSAGSTRVLHEGLPFRDPQGITVIGDTVIVADTRAGELRSRADAPGVKFSNGVIFALPLQGGNPVRLFSDQVFVTLVGSCTYFDGDGQYLRFWDIDGARRDTSKYAWMPHSGFALLKRVRIESVKPLTFGPVETVPFIEEFPIKFNVEGLKANSIVVLRGLNGTTLAGGNESLVLKAAGPTTVIVEGATTESKLSVEATIIEDDKPIFGPGRFDIPKDDESALAIARDNKHAGARADYILNGVDVTVDGIPRTVGLFPRQGGVITLIWQGPPLSTPMASQASWDGSLIYVTDLSGGPNGTGAVWQLPMPSMAQISSMYSSGNAWKVRPTSALWLRTQEGDPVRDVWTPANPYAPTVQGCLQNVGIRYSVVAQDGTAYNLTGNAARLRPFIGHEVEITGKPTVKSLSTTEKDIASTVEEIPTLDFKSVKELSKTCNPGK